MKRRKFLFLLLALVASMTAFAQKTNYSGVVVDGQGEPIIGASVVQKGTSQGSVTDVDGRFNVSVDAGSTLVISYIGYQTQEVAARQNMRIVLAEDEAISLNDVVVVGYGVQKKSVVTAAIAKVSAQDLEGKTPVRMDNALKGLAAGVQVTSASGQPGEAPRVRVRGTSSVNSGNDPLYIVDGMPISGGLDFVNPSDIESIEVLKDAASAAIYGARAANGVVLVTTKKGKMGKTSINYNFSYGWQSAWRKRDLTGATDYAILQNERSVNGGGAPIFADPYNLVDTNGKPIKGFGTDWQSLVFNDNAPVVNHEVSVSGATEKINYFLSMGYYTQDGIVGGNKGVSNYNRLSLRSNTMYNLLDASEERSFLNKLDLTVNLAYTRVKSRGISTNSEFGSILGSALYLAPTLSPTVDPNSAVGQGMINAYENAQGFELLRDAKGNLYTVPGYGGTYQEINNPLAMLEIPVAQNWSHKFVPKFQFDLQLWDNIKYHFSYSADMSFWGYDSSVLSLYYLSGNNFRNHTSAAKRSDKGTVWQVENTLTWDKQFGKHNIAVVLGQSAMKNKSDYLGAERWNLVNLEKPYMSYTNANVIYKVDDMGVLQGIPYAEFNGYGGPNVEHHVSSLFGRVSYNYDERYMLQATIRRDGSSRFGPNNKYGTFPSASIGWNIHNEKFMEQTRDWLTNMKFRASWGKNGNDNIGDFRYTVASAMGSNVLFGNPAVKFTGSKASTTANPDLKWEESEQTDIGMDFGFFNNRLTFTVDYFIKKTNGMIIESPIPSYVGESKPLANVGDMENKGWEFELGYKFNVGDARFAIKGNASYLKNTLKNLGNDSGYIDLDGVQGISGGGTRGENGQPFPFFYGYKTNGVFQTWDEVNAYVNADGNLIQPDAQPGFTRFVDVDGDGQITTADRTNIGNGTPDWTFGLDINAEWRGIDFRAFFQGVSGADVFDATYRQDIYSGNYPEWMLGRWTGPGTSNKYPILMSGNTTNWQMSDLYIYDGSYLRLKNISLGYTLPQNITQRVGIERLRFYVMAENLITWTKYHGFDPEISSSGTSLGIDRGIYPQARTWYVGLNLSF
ncbi:MAG: TonB-dependent receptor [Prevotella sp.]|nr:TonB-dependent receptor [Prevotella sp.]